MAMVMGNIDIRICRERESNGNEEREKKIRRFVCLVLLSCYQCRMSCVSSSWVNLLDDKKDGVFRHAFNSSFLLTSFRLFFPLFAILLPYFWFEVMLVVFSLCDDLFKPYLSLHPSRTSPSFPCLYV